VMHTALDLVRQAARWLESPVVISAPTRRLSPEPPPTIGTSDVPWAFGARGGVLALSSAGHIACWPRPASHSSTPGGGSTSVRRLHQPLGLPAQLHVEEWVPMPEAYAGAPVLTSWLRVQVAVDLDIWQQRYRYADDAGNAGRGSRLEPAMAASLLLSAALSPGWWVGAQVGALATLMRLCTEPPRASSGAHPEYVLCRALCVLHSVGRKIRPLVRTLVRSGALNRRESDSVVVGVRPRLSGGAVSASLRPSVSEVSCE